MYSFNRFVKGDVLISPFSPQQKLFWEHAGSALVGAAGSLLGGIFGSSSQSAANRTNLQIAQMNNEFNERMLDKQIDYNTQMWNKQNQYNTPAAQAARYEAAGMNPYLMMSQGGTAGSATSANGVNPPTASEVGRQQANTAMAEAIDNAGRNAVTFGQQAEQLASNLEVNQSVIDKNKAEATEKLANAARTEALTPYERDEINAKINKINEESKTQQSIQRINNQVAKTEFYRTELTRIQSLVADKELQGWDEKRKMELASMAADIKLKYAQGQLSYAQAFQAMQQGYLAISFKATEDQTRAGKVSESFWKGREAKFRASKYSWEALNQNALDHSVINYNNERSYSEIKRRSSMGFNLNIPLLGKFGFDFDNYK